LHSFQSARRGEWKDVAWRRVFIILSCRVFSNYSLCCIISQLGDPVSQLGDPDAEAFCAELFLTIARLPISLRIHRRPRCRRLHFRCNSSCAARSKTWLGSWMQESRKARLYTTCKLFRIARPASFCGRLSAFGRVRHGAAHQLRSPEARGESPANCAAECSQRRRHCAVR
jgi:hypothetical protein